MAAPLIVLLISSGGFRGVPGGSMESMEPPLASNVFVLHMNKDREWPNKRTFANNEKMHSKDRATGSYTYRQVTVVALILS